MIKVDENDPVGELQPSFPYRDVTVRRNVDVKEFYELESEIGRGKFGTVYRCKEKSTGLTLAAKFVGIAKRQDRRNVEREVEIMRTLQHPRLIQLYDAFESQSVMCVIQELIEGGELFERVIDDDFILTEKACSVFMRQICEGVEFIHSQNILHLDLKPENILCLTRTGNRIKIIDFGLARKFEPDKKLQVLFGTPEFVAPEVVNFELIGYGTDMWSVGVICYVLLSGLSPFMGETDVETMANVTIAQYDFDDEAFDDISDDAKDFISKLLLKNKEQRLTATECLSHKWLRRKLPPPSTTTPTIQPQITTVKQSIELIPHEILDNTKENLRDFVERWNDIENTSPSKIITIPSSGNINEPFKEINQNQSIKLLPNMLNDFNKNLIKDETKIIQENSNATQISDGNQVPEKKLKLDIDNNNLMSSCIYNNSNNNNINLKSNEEETKNNEKTTLISPTISQPPKYESQQSSDITNKTFSSVTTPSSSSQPVSPIGTIPKTPSGSKLKFPSIINNEFNDKNLTEYSNTINQSSFDNKIGTGAIPKISSGDNIDNSLIKSKQISNNREIIDSQIDCQDPKHKNIITNDRNISRTDSNNKIIIDDQIINSNENNDKLSKLSNIIGSRSNDIIYKQSTNLPTTSNIQKHRLLSQLSVPDLTKCTLNKNIPVKDLKSNELNIKKDNHQSILNDNKKDIKELNISEGKFNNTLNKHVVPPKIHGIVLGRNDNQETDSVSIETKSPKIITHKIFVEGRNDQSSTIDKENKKNDSSRTYKPISKSQTSSKLEIKDTNVVNKNKQFANKFLSSDRFDRRGSDISCFLHKTDNIDGINLSDEIKKLSDRLFKMGGNQSNDDYQENNNITKSKPIPISSSYKNDPIGRFLANHGVVTRRPKYRMSYLNRDVPIGSPPPASNLFYHLSHTPSGGSWCDNQTHSAPQSPSITPERDLPTGSITRDVIMRLFDKNIPTQYNNRDEDKTAGNSIDSLASYFKTNKETTKSKQPHL